MKHLEITEEVLHTPIKKTRGPYNKTKKPIVDTPVVVQPLIEDHSKCEQKANDLYTDLCQQVTSVKALTENNKKLSTDFLSVKEQLASMTQHNTFLENTNEEYFTNIEGLQDELEDYLTFTIEIGLALMLSIVINLMLLIK